MQVNDWILHFTRQDAKCNECTLYRGVFDKVISPEEYSVRSGFEFHVHVQINLITFSESSIYIYSMQHIIQVSLILKTP